MRTHIQSRVRRAFTLIEILIVVVILGILAAIVIPQFTDASMEASVANLLSQLQTVRSQIELFNVQNPATPYDALTPIGGTVFWDESAAGLANGLVPGNYLQAMPKNPLQNGSNTVEAAAAAGVGWVWGPDASGNAWTLNIYAVDETGAVLDADGDGNWD